MRWLIGLDERMVAAANRATHAHPLAQRSVAVLANSLAVADVALMVVLALRGQVAAAVRMLGAVALIYGLVELIGRLVRRQRPFQAVDAVSQVVSHTAHRSFPSRHAASAFAMAAIAQPAHTSIAGVMTRLAWLMALVRIGAGLHYPSDVIAGAALGEVVGRLLRR